MQELAWEATIFALWHRMAITSFAKVFALSPGRFVLAPGSGDVRKCLKRLAGTAGLEPAAAALTARPVRATFNDREDPDVTASPPAYELECYRALAEAFPGDHLRFDPNCAWCTEQGIQFARAIEGFNNDYLEDPVFGLNGTRRVREKPACLWLRTLWS